MGLFGKSLGGLSVMRETTCFCKNNDDSPTIVLTHARTESEWFVQTAPKMSKEFVPLFQPVLWLLDS